MHRVCITEDYWLGATPVTQAQFAVWTAEAGINHKNHFTENPTHPADSMSWFEADSYCAWLCQCGTGFPPGSWSACLPTETQWEVACRAGADTEYYNGDGITALEGVAWFGEDWDEGSTHPVADKKKQPNKWGLYDMHGNVWEWCSDVFDPDAYKERSDGVSDPCVGADDVEERLKRTRDYWEIVGQPDWGKDKAEDLPRVLRGGSWFNTAVRCRSASRVRVDPGVRVRSFGFRVCLVRRPSRTKTTQTDEAERQQSRRAELRAKPERSPDGMQPRSPRTNDGNGNGRGT